MRNFKSKTVGILGAIIIHLIAAIIFMLVQLGSLSQNNPAEMLLEFEKPEETPLADQKTEIAKTKEEIYGSKEISNNAEQLYNIARNLANQPEEKIDVNAYIDKVKDELIQSGKLGLDNYIDDQKKNRNILDKDGTTIEDPVEKSDIDKKDELAKMASEYKGPTRIYYNLPGRYHTYLPIPIYKCEGSGKVTLTIDVNPIGEVTKAEIIAAESSTSEECLIETAVSSALKTRFNPDANVLKTEAGTLTYEFVAQ
jgi:hypothetical protein